MLKLNVGLSRKMGEPNYGSRGASVNMELELDSSLIGDATKLKDRIRQLFTLVRSSLTDELNGANSKARNQQWSTAAAPANSPKGHQNDHDNAQSPVAPNGQRSSGERLATPAQLRAIHAIARSRQIDVTQFLQNRFQVAGPDDLSLEDASLAIDELRDLEVPKENE